MAQPRHIDPSKAERLFISTTPGLEPALDAEVRALGIGLWRVDGGVEVEGPPGLHQRLNLLLRTASRILLRVAQFPAKDFAALEQGLQKVDLAPFRPPEGVAMEVGATAHRSRVSHAGRIREVAARAWKLPSGVGAQPDEHDAQYVQLRVEDDLCTVSVDTSGELLYRRGYRQEISRAPLRETLASGLLLLAGYRGDEPLWDPMCGSGTIAIEAALLAARRAPGASRTFAFQRWPGYDAAAWERLVEEGRRAKRPPPAAIHATDIHAGSLGTARRNARRAGVGEYLKLERVDVRAPSMVPPDPSGLLITNPPYGMRVGEQGELAPLYAALGALLREKLPGWRAGILVPDAKLERALGLTVADAFEVQNGGIRCRFILCEPNRRPA